MVQFDQDLPFDNIEYDHGRGIWVVTDNDTSTAEQIKILHPFDPVYLYDPDTKKYTRFTINYTHRKPHMSNGKLIYTEETIEI